LQLARFGEQQQARIRELTELNERRLGEIRSTLEQKIKDLQTDNSAKLEQMRHTVDERLHATLEQRLGESFKLVSDRLEAVQRGLGEMQSLAQGVGDLKRVLTNVKTRGTWGEVQLDQLLEQILTQDQYAKNVATKPGSRDHVEFALRLPGQNGQGVWLPIDAKFPVEDYERLLSAHERADLAGVEEAAKALETRLKTEGRVIRDKYLSPPHTTEFALLYLPTEGLYAEALRRPGLTDFLQREYRVTVAGPTTLTAMLNALQMGFKTLAIEKRSSEVWALLGSVKTEFGKFGDLLAKSKAQLQTVLNTMDSAESKTRTIERKLRDVEQLPVEQQQPLGLDTQPE
jgi:DNA recombination protein RmuC